MSDVPSSPQRRLLSGLGGVVRLVAIGVALVAVVLIRNQVMTADVEPTPSPQGATAIALGAADDPTPTAVATPTPAEATPAPSETTPPTFEPDATSQETPAPTPRPTTKPTARPITKPTPKPTHDPTPEGTPRTTSRSGSFGQTLTVQGIAVRVAKTSPHEGALACTTDDPDRQGWTELVSYDLTMTWPDGGDAEEPWVAVGSKPWNVLNFDGPSPFRSGAAYTVSTCHRPADSDKVMVEISPPGSPIIYYRWFFD